MKKNKIQFQKGHSLFEFMRDYGTEEQCEKALLAWRYPGALSAGNAAIRPIAS